MKDLSAIAAKYSTRRKYTCKVCDLEKTKLGEHGDGSVRGLTRERQQLREREPGRGRPTVSASHVRQP